MKSVPIVIFLSVLVFIAGWLATTDVRRLLAQVAPGPNEAIFSFLPSTGTFSVGDTFIVDLRISTTVEITSIKKYVNFSPTLLSVQSIDSVTSVFPHEFEQTFDNTSGKIQLQRSKPIPGFNDNGLNPGIIAKVTFQALAAGIASLTYDSTSLALKTDDINVLNLTNSTGASFTINASPPPNGGGGAGGGGGGSGTGGGGGAVLKGDCNSDGKVNIFDLSIMLSNWKKATTTCDLNGDSIINIFDFSILLSNWTK